jgi:hypothetical protein
MRLIKIKNTHKKTVLIVDADSIMAVEERDGFEDSPPGVDIMMRDGTLFPLEYVTFKSVARCL